jgi:hypothetical protein
LQSTSHLPGSVVLVPPPSPTVTFVPPVPGVVVEPPLVAPPVPDVVLVEPPVEPRPAGSEFAVQPATATKANAADRPNVASQVAKRL